MNLAKRILFGIGLGRVSAPSNEAGAVQMLQLAHRTGETQDNVPSVQQYGLASVPLPGCDHVVVYAEGDRSKGVAIASNDQRYRPKSMAAGEVKIYDNSGQFVYLSTGSKILINAASEVDVKIGGALVLKVTAGGISVTGTISATGDITAGSISLEHHTHPDPQGGTVGAPT